MDTTTLVNAIKELIAAFAKEGKIVTAASLLRVYPGYESSPYIVAMACPWTANYHSSYSKTKEMVEKSHAWLSREKRDKIYAIHVFDNEAQVQQFVNEGGGGLALNLIDEFAPQLEVV